MALTDEDHLKAANCPLCGKELSVNNNLKVHLDIHTGGYPDSQRLQVSAKIWYFTRIARKTTSDESAAIQEFSQTSLVIRF